MKNRVLIKNLGIIITKQNKRFVAYSPALDISTSGKSVKDVQNKFSELATIFLEEVAEAGTAEDVLTELGWKKAQKSWNPPQIISSDSIGIKMPSFA